MLKKPIFILLMTALLLALLLIGCGQKTSGGDTPPAVTSADNPTGTQSNEPTDGTSQDNTSAPQGTQGGLPENTPVSSETDGQTAEGEDETDAMLDSILEQLDSLDKLYSDLEEDNLADSDLTGSDPTN